jgi:prepilin-type N-terminal cleavage/methylation domain-containing protein
MAAHYNTARRPTGHRGFTLIEMLVVIGIIALIGGLVLAATMHSRTTALVIRARSDLSLLETSLSAYRADFGDYPRFPDPATVQSAKSVTGSGYWLDSSADRGARLLCRALLGPGAAGSLATANPGEDGADGPGFRTRRNLITSTATPTLGGKVSGPYIQPDKFKIEYDPSMTYSTSTMSGAYADAKLLDFNGNPILYFPAATGVPVVSQTGGFVAKFDPTTATAPYTPPPPLYNQYDNQTDTTPSAAGRTFLPLKDMQYILGDRNLNGTIDAGEAAVTTQPYLLWTAGPSGKYGLQIDTTALTSIPAGQKSDAVCNFDLPADIRK